MAKISLQLTEIFCCAVRQVILHLGPDEFVRIDLGRVRWKAMRSQSRIPPQEGQHVPALMNRAAIPEQFDRASQMTKEMAKKHDDFRPSDVVGCRCIYRPSLLRDGETDTAEIADSLSRL
jgi:hypothetical protein